MSTHDTRPPTERLRALRSEMHAVGNDPEASPTTAPVTLDELEQDIMTVLHVAMTFGDPAKRLSAAAAGIKYLAVKARIPIPTGEGFDEEVEP